VESLVSAALIVIVLRSRRPLHKNRSGKYLLIAILSVVVFTMFLPSTGLGRLFGFTPMPMSFYLLLLGIVGIYIVSAELAKRFFYKKVGLKSQQAELALLGEN
jgi:Mg2+-importing ATPase